MKRKLYFKTVLFLESLKGLPLFSEVLNVKKYSVFVSSTYEDLKDERISIIDILLDTDCFPYAMEHWPSSDKSPWSTIKKAIDASDYYILIIAGRYGSINKSIDLDLYEGMSYVEMEFRYALQQKKPILAFFQNEESIKVLEPDYETREKLKQFKNLVMTNGDGRHVNFWSRGNDLQTKILHGLSSLIRNRPSVGWVRHSTTWDWGKKIPNVYINTRKEIDNQKSLAERWEGARKIQIANFACQSIINPQNACTDVQRNSWNELFYEQLQKGTQFYIILNHPNSYAAFDAAENKIRGDSLGVYPTEHNKWDVIPKSVNELFNKYHNYMQKPNPQLACRLAQFSLPYAVMIVNYHDNADKSDFIKIDLYSFMAKDYQRPSFYILKETAPEMFEYFQENFSDMWQSSHRVQYDSQRINYKTINKEKYLNWQNEAINSNRIFVNED